MVQIPPGTLIFFEFPMDAAISKHIILTFAQFGQTIFPNDWQKSVGNEDVLSKLGAQKDGLSSAKVSNYPTLAI